MLQVPEEEGEAIGLPFHLGREISLSFGQRAYIYGMFQTIFRLLEGTAPYGRLLLAPAEGFGAFFKNAFFYSKNILDPNKFKSM